MPGIYLGDCQAAKAAAFATDAKQADILAWGYCRFTRRYLGTSNPSQWGGSSRPKGWPRKGEQIVTNMCAIHCPTRISRSQIPLPATASTGVVVLLACRCSLPEYSLWYEIRDVERTISGLSGSKR